MLRPQFRSFQTKLLFFMAGGLVLLQLVTLIAVRVAGRSSLRQTVSEELEVASRVFERLLSARGQRFADTAKVLAADFAFREVVASEDARTIRSALANHGARMDADRMFLASLDGQILAATTGGLGVESGFPYPALLERAKAEGEAYGLVAFAGQPLQLVVLPVLAPEPIAFVALGFAIDGDFLEEVSRLTSTELSLVRPLGAEGGFAVSSLSTADAADFLGSPLHAARVGDGALTVELSSGRYEACVKALQTADGSSAELWLKRSIEDAWRPFRVLEVQIFVLATLAMLVAIAGATFLARNVSRPLRRLVDAAQEIERGDYTTDVSIERTDELGTLAGAFNDMRLGIREREAKILFQSTHDDLTGLPNRSLFMDRLNQAIRKAKRSKTELGVLILDVDRFMEINDTLGHEAGDELLTAVAQRLRQSIREADTLARLGGDEFAMLLEESDEAGCLEVSRRIQAALEEAFTFEDVPVSVTASIGVSLYPGHADDAGGLVKCADVAVYDAKKNQVPVATYERERDDHSLRRLSILAALAGAAERDEFELHYQPKIDISSRRVVHVEALVRWTHPELGFIPPDEFITQAERSGRVRLVTDWVLRRAIRDCAAWREAGHDVGVAVNVSALDLRELDLSSRVSAELEKAGLPPSRLVLEVTESAVMKDAGAACRVLAELKKSGVGIAIDDFGTGYSSLSQLRKLPVTELKVDRSFVMKLESPSSEDAVIVRSTIELAHNLALEVVAEGVETQEGWDTLQKLGCDLAQGYFISKPLPLADLEQWMATSEFGGSSRVADRIA